MRSLIVLLGVPMAAIVAVFNLRRIVFTLTVLLDRGVAEDEVVGERDLPTVLVLAPCRDEEAMLPGLAESLRRIDYPPEKLQVVLVDDGSEDGTAEAMRRAADREPGWDVFTLSAGAGKAAALNAALARHGFGECVYVLDADHRPSPPAVRRVMEALSRPGVAAAQGLNTVSEPLASPSAYYSTVESYVNQLVTIRAKDRLRLAPALLGSNCGYRRDALIGCGGFRRGAFSEDSDLTVAFHAAGYVTRFVEGAVSSHQVPRTVGGYIRQHVRWGRGLNDVARTHVRQILRSPRLRPALRVELMLFASGYLDRLAVLGVGALTAASYLAGGPVWFLLPFLLLAAATPLVQIAVLFAKERMGAPMWLRLPLVPAFFALDVLAAIRSALDTVAGAPKRWTRTERVGELER